MNNEFEHIDRIIREKFSDFAPQPPATLWDKIRKQLGGTGGGAILFPVLTITGLVFVILALLVNEMPSGMHSTLMAGNIEQKAPDLRFISSMDDQPMTIRETELVEKETHYVMEGPEATASVETPAGPAPASGLQAAPATKQNEDIKTIEERAELLSGRMKMTRGFVSDPGIMDLALIPKKSTGDYYRRNNLEWTLGLMFNPEASLNRDPDIENSQNLGLHLTATLKKGNLIVQSGLGVRNSNDRGNYEVTYNKYLGTYHYVYEVTYDSTENGVVPTYHTVPKDVYDSIPHYAVTQSRIHYRYLEIPLLIGYQKDFRKISLLFKGGVNTSILMNSGVRNTSFIDEKIQIIADERDELRRTDITWQLMFTAGMSYRLNNRFSLGIEPSFRYFLNSEYINVPDNRNSFGIGVRAGILYHINR